MRFDRGIYNPLRNVGSVGSRDMACWGEWVD